MNIPKPTPPKERLHVKPSAATMKLSEEIRKLSDELTKEYFEEHPEELAKLRETPAKRDDETMQQYSDRLDALKPKRPRIHRDHLVQWAFRDNPELQELQKKLEKPKPPVKRNPHRKTSTKTQEKK